MPDFCPDFQGEIQMTSEFFDNKKKEGSICMIKLAFGESPAGALKLAKSMKQGDRLTGAIAVLGG